MKTHLERASFEHVQTFAHEFGLADELDAVEAGFTSATRACVAMLEHASEAWALIGERGRVLAMCAVRPGGRVWVHTSGAFKLAGVGGLRQVRQLFVELLERHAVLELDVDPRNGALVRLAEWVGFKHQAFVDRGGRPFHHAVLRA